MTRKVLVGLAAVALVAAALVSQQAFGQRVSAQSSKQMPVFQVDPHSSRRFPTTG